MVRAESVTATLVYTYTAQGLRVMQSVDGYETTFAWDWAFPLAQVLSTSDGTQDVYGLGRVGEMRDGSWAYPLLDALSSARQWTDSSGAVIYAAGYTPYGEGGYTGEWTDPNLGMVYLRARWYEPQVGRFTQRDVWSGSHRQPQTLNRYIYVINRPIILIDPSGLQVCGSYCGPDITDWFAEEMDIHWNWVLAEKGAFEAETGRLYRECMRTTTSRGCAGIYIARTEIWLLSFRDYAKAIPYKWMNFRNLVPGCPYPDCWFTVTLCDTCIERSELGNIMFGFSAKPWGWPGWVARQLALAVGALQEEWDKAAAGIGYYLAEEYISTGPPDSEAMCSFMRACEGSWEFREAHWKNIQDPLRTEGCQACATPVPPSTPHSTPAFAGAPAGYSYPWAGAPDYVYYTEQMPAGMLDPLMLAPPLPFILR
jgi:RHS repeat-associated protein